MNFDLSNLAELFGREHDSGSIHRELKYKAYGTSAGAVGAVLVCCSDEALNETSDGFVRGFTSEMLPSLKRGLRAPFRNITPGGVYTWGAARIAIGNFSHAVPSDSFLLLVTKVEAHTAVERDGVGVRFGHKRRYAGEGTFCGALDALLAGRTDSWLTPMREAFDAEGKDRVGALREAPEDDRMLLTAATSARLMARNVAMDMQDFDAPVPTVHLVLHGVVLNKEGADTELLGGAYLLDRRTDRGVQRYLGIGDDPTRYVVEKTDGPVRLHDDELATERDARDHRAMARVVAETHAASSDPRVAELRASIAAGGRGGGPWGRALLRASLALLAEVAPLPTALFLLADGWVEIRNAHRLSRTVHRHEAELRRLEAAHAVARADRHVDSLSDEEATALAARLLRSDRPVEG
ncbi:MAG: hypothetical protein ACF8XB_21875 [Planctomycetota bacterium JB042]